MLKSPLLRWTLPWLGAFLLLRLIFWVAVFPNPDEAYYWLWGQHPGFSYYDHPPFQAWMQALSWQLFGRSQLVLRLSNLGSTGLLLFTYWHICRYLYREKSVALWLITVALVAASPLFFLFLAIAWPDHWLIAFVTLSGYCLVRFLDDYLDTGKGDSRWLYAAASTFALACLCKYNAIFLGLGAAATVLSQQRLRPLLRDRRLYLAVGLGALVLSPILIWNLRHDFFSFRYYLERSAGNDRLTLQPFQPIVFLLLCALILGPLHSWGLAQLAQQGSQTRSRSIYAVLAGWVFSLSTGAFILLSLGSVAIYYWNIVAYPLLLPLMAPVFLRAPRQLLIAQGLGIVAAAGLLIHYAVLPLTAVGGSPDPDSAALYGWPTIASQVRQSGRSLQNPLLLTTDYRSAAALAYSLNTPNVVALSGRLDQFDFWYDADTLAGRDAILLGEAWHPICPAHLAMFERSDPPREITIRRFGRPLQTYTLVQAYGFKAGPSSYPLRPDYPLAGSSDGEDCGQ